ncbi:MAG: ATP:cob(I)alamin adenosyltransferase, partial [Dehalococcoidia bacterium]
MTSSTKIYTGRGDGGETGLLYGGRVSKADLRCEAYGTLDEAVSAMGLARSLSAKEDVRTILVDLQKEAFTVGGELATDADYYDKFLKHFGPVSPQMVTRLEKLTDEFSSKIDLPKEFIMPGGTPGAAAID